MTDIKRGRRMPFVILPWSVLEDPNLTAHDVLVYATIARWADNNTGVAFPSRATIAETARVDIKTVDRCVARLVSAGYLEKHKRKHELGESNLYVVHEIVARQETLTPRGTNGATPPRGRGTNGAGGRGTNGAGTRLIQLEQDALDYTRPADPSEWTAPPDDIRAMMQPQPPGEAA
jgi:hypothetical protein